MKTLAILSLMYKLAPLFLRQQQQPQVQYKVMSDKDKALLNLKKKDGAVILILGKRESGKTVLSQRLAEFLGRPTYCISPNQKPLSWMTEIKLEDIDNVPPNSTLIMDDIPLYLSSRDYNEAIARNVERLIPVVRHRKIMLIFISQTSGFADRWTMDADCIFLKQSSILYADIERPAVKKLMDKATPYFGNQTDIWLKKHAYFITDSFEGVIEIKKVSGETGVPVEGEYHEL